MTRAADLVRARAEALRAHALKHETAFGAHTDCCAEYAADVCDELAAQIDALPAEPVGAVRLPVIATCGECKHCTAMGRPNVKVPRRPLTDADLARIVAFYHCEHDDVAPHRDNTGVVRVLRNDPPPAWCPLRKETP